MGFPHAGAFSGRLDRPVRDGRFVSLGFLRMEGISKDEPLGWQASGRHALFDLLISLVPGMFGGKLGELDAYIPLAGGPPAPRRPARTPWSG